MPPNVGAGYIEIVPTIASGWQRQLTTDVSKATKGIAGQFSNTFRNIAVGAGAIFAGKKVFDFLGDAVDEGRESLKITRLTEAALESTGGVANVTADEVADLAETLSELTGVDDELIQSSENLLLSFTNVRNELGDGNDIFDQATEASLDLSARGFGSVESASVMLGKALNDPLRGITALGRAGVTFTDQQKEQIRTLVEQNDLLGAQGIILDEVARQVGGSAEAAATPWDRLKVTLGNLREELGIYLIPKLDDAATWLVEKLPGAVDATKRKFGELRTFFEEEIGPKLETFGGIIGDSVYDPIAGLIGYLIEHEELGKAALFGLAVGMGAYAIASIAAAAASFVALLPFYLVIAAIILLAAQLYYAWNNWEDFRHAVAATVAFILIFGPKVVDFFRTLWSWADTALDTLFSVLGVIKDIVTLGPDLDTVGIGVTGPLGPIFEHFGKRAKGGPVDADEPYIVGDRFGINSPSAELFVPNQSGFMIPRVPDTFETGGGEGQSFTQIIHNPTPEPAGDSARKLRRVALEMAS